MRHPHRPGLLVPCLFLVLAALPAAAAPPAIEHELRYDARRFSVVERGGETWVDMQGATREFTPGRPDLPLIGEPIELPDDVRVTGVEVISLGTALLSDKVRVPSAAKAVPGLGPIVRTPPDPAFFGRSGFAPVSSQATLGYEGFMRGKHVAWLSVSPTRWDPASGRLERITRMTVRLTLEPYHSPDAIHRERVVQEWEDGPFGGPHTVAAARRPDVRPEPFAAQQLPSVLGSPVQYLIITSDALAGEFQRLADWKTQSGVPAVVRTLSFVRQQYPFGTDDADRIRQFIRDAYSRWSTKWVLLGGDTDVIPYRMIYTTFFSGENIPCDMYFSCLDGTWNADGDSSYGEGYYNVNQQGDACDLLPDVYVGRAPVTTVTDVQRFVNKTFQYERTPVGDYEHMVQFFAEVLFPQPWSPGQATSLDGAELVEEVLPSLNSNPGIHYLRQYENYTDSRWTPGSLQETKEAVIDSLNVGYNMAVHVGHGYRNVMSCGDATLENSDVLALTNGNRLSNMYAIDCTSNAIDFPCIGEAFLLAPNGGAVTNIGSSRFDFPHAGRAFQAEYMKLMFHDSVTAVGETQARQKLPFAGQSVTDNINRWTETTLLMLGDPELREWTGKPRTLAVTHPASYTLTDTTMTVNVKIGATPLYGARVTLYKPGDDYRSVTTDGAGNAVVDFRPGSIGTFYVTVTGYDCRPVQDTLTVTAPAPAALADLAPTIDDDTFGGTSGNDNGQFDAGEVVDVHVSVINRGGTSSSGVVGVVSTTDGLVTISNPGVTYGTVAPGATSTGTGAFRVSVPFTCPDQREIPFSLSLNDNGGHHFVQRFTITVHAPDPRQFSHTIQDPGGNNDGVPNTGETITMLARLRNLGTGPAPAVTVKLRNYDGMATVTDSMAAFGTISPGAEVQGDPLVYVVGNTAAQLELRISDSYGLLSTQMLDLVPPSVPIDLKAVGSQTSISLTWAHVTAPDIAGYNIYRSTTPAGTYTKVNTVPTDRTSYYQDEGLSPLTRYYYKVTAVDSSGNESSQSLQTDASTNPPNHAIFPVEMRRQTPASVAIEHVYQATMMDIVAGADVVWLWHADGTAPIDADGTAVSHGDFTTKGTYYAAGPSLAKLDGINWSIVAGSWKNTAPESLAVYVFDRQGQVRPGWPFRAADGLFSGIAIGDLNNDGSSELVFASNGNKLYALRANGTEWMDGDNNPATQGVFKVLGNYFNYGTPALADLDNNGQLDIIYASTDGNLYAWRPDGTNLPGFPVFIGSGTSSSVAVGYLDGPGDTQLDIVVTSNNNNVYVVKADGTGHTGFPVFIRFTNGTGRNPSPALADINGDGFLDIVCASTDGKLYVLDHNGIGNPNFVNARYSEITDGYASESSPVVADINGDGIPDIVQGDENGVLNAFSGNGQLLPGFPIQLGGEVRGTPALCDCDGDGMSEIVVSSWDENTYVWDYDFPFSPAGPPPWPQFHHDARRTGTATNPAFVDAPPPIRPAAPAALEFAVPVPNPTSARAHVAWAVPADMAGSNLDVSIYDLAGRRVATLASGQAEPGRFSADWDLRTDAGSRAGGGLYFVRLRVGATLRSHKLVVMP